MFVVLIKLIIIGFAGFYYLKKSQTRGFFYPESFFIFFGLVSLFSSLGLTNQEQKWDILMYAVVYMGIFAYYLGNKFINLKRNKVVNIESGNLAKLSEQSILIFSTIIWGIASLAMLYEYYKLGEIPLLSSNSELIRFQLPANGLIHIIAVMNRIVIIINGIYLINDNFKKINKFLIFQMITSTILLLGTGFRGEVIIPYFVLLIFYACIKKIKLRYVVIIGIMFVIILGFWPLIRKYNLYGSMYIEDIKAISTFKDIYYLTPLYQTFSMNFEILRQLINTFPLLSKFRYGFYTFVWPFYTLLPGDQVGSLGDVQNQIWQNNFYAKLTSTYMGSLYADGGIIFVILISFIMGILIAYVYKQSIVKCKIEYLALYSYLYYVLILGLYDNGFTFDNIVYSIIIFIVIKLSTKKIVIKY